MAELPAMGIMDFVQRFHALQVQRDTSDGLIKDILMYCDGLQRENETLVAEIRNAQLDLEDSRKSRRDLQEQLLKVTQNCNFMEVGRLSLRQIRLLIEGRIGTLISWF